MCLVSWFLVSEIPIETRLEFSIIVSPTKCSIGFPNLPSNDRKPRSFYLKTIYSPLKRLMNMIIFPPATWWGVTYPIWWTNPPFRVGNHFLPFTCSFLPLTTYSHTKQQAKSILWLRYINVLCESVTVKINPKWTDYTQVNSFYLFHLNFDD